MWELASGSKNDLPPPTAADLRLLGAWFVLGGIAVVLVRRSNGYQSLVDRIPLVRKLESGPGHRGLQLLVPAVAVVLGLLMLVASFVV